MRRLYLLAISTVLLTSGACSDATAPVSAPRQFPARSSASIQFGTWSGSGNLVTARYGHVAALLSNGDVLIAGGAASDALASAEIYHSGTGVWSGTGSMNTAREDFAGTSLPNGRVLVAGGRNNVSALASAELYDPATGAWNITGSMNTARESHTATLLPNGQVLVVGGGDRTCRTGCGPYVSAELYDPGTGAWTSVGPMRSPRLNHSAVLLANGKVLVAGGNDGSCSPASCGQGVWASAELYDPASNTWSSTGSMISGRSHHTLTLLADGRVLAVGGGLNDNSGCLASSEIYNPATGNWSSAGLMSTPRCMHSASVLRDGTVLVAGGTTSNSSPPVASAEVFDPASGAWNMVASMSSGRASYTATLLPGSQGVLVAGGAGGSVMGQSELYSSTVVSPPPTVMLSTTPQVSAGGYRTCALKIDGTVSCWGAFGAKFNPAELVSVARVSVGTQSCALKTDGRVVCWGYAYDDGLATVPAGLGSVVQVSVGQYQTCTLKTDETVICWGNFDNTNQAPVPAGLGRVAQVSAGFDHICALKTDGTVVCWGDNDDGETNVPVGLGSVTQVSAGNYHSCALRTDGTVVCWGRNTGGEATVPIGLASVGQISAGGYHTCALKANRTVVCWGNNDQGQATVPTGLASVAQISVGWYHTCALKTDGTVVCWGQNLYGETTVPAGLNFIVSAPQSISFTSIVPSPAYVGATYAVTATATSGLPVAFSTSTPGTCSVSGGTVTFIAVGTCTVAADQAGDATHLAAAEQTQSITVVKRPQTITFTSTAPNLPLVNATYAMTATASSGLAVSVTSLTPGTCKVTGSTATFVAAGSCTIAADQVGDATYLAAPEQKQSITIITAAQAILNLTTTIAGMGLPGGVATSLSAPLNNLNTNNLTSACGKLNAFVNQVNAKVQTGQLTVLASSQLLQAANAIKASLGCA